MCHSCATGTLRVFGAGFGVPMGERFQANMHSTFFWIPTFVGMTR
jgi:hypothetical protein